MNKNNADRISWNIAILMLLTLFLSLNIQVYAALDDISSLEYEIYVDYETYLNQYEGFYRPDREIVIPAIDYSRTDTEVEIIDNLAGYNGKALKTPESGLVEWEFYVEDAGFYNISLEYYPLEGMGSKISRSLYINGEIPFGDARYLEFHRIWKDAGEIRKDNRGNEIAPSQVEAPEWIEVNLVDSLGYYNEPYLFYFQEGINTIAIEGKKEPMAIGKIKIYQAKESPSYADKLLEYEKMGYKKTEGVFVKVQAENVKLKSSSTIYPIYDLSDPLLEPYHHAQIRLNVIGGNRWQEPGDWAEWEIEVPEDGLYVLGFKAKQNLIRGIYTSRRLYIDGEVPFKEAENIEFNFSNDYEMIIPGNEEGEPYYFYLSKGKHTIRLEVVLGRMANIIRKTENNLYELNNIFRQIIMITSATPDRLRDYRLQERIPHVIENLKEKALELKDIADELALNTGELGGQVAQMHAISRQLLHMAENPRTIHRRIQPFRDYLGNLGNWLMDVSKQPLTLDYLVVASPDVEMPRVKPNFFETAKHEVKKYIASYFVNYDMIGDVYEEDSDKKPLKVWIAQGFDQAQILKRMIEDDFTPKTGIYVNLELVQLGNLLPATLAGIGPDVALGMQSFDPINFAIRNAVVDLTQFPDFEEVKKRFHESAFVPFTFRDRVYALPQQQVFAMMFYRKDILHELGLGIPDTWDEVFELIPELQKNNMNFGLPVNDLNARRAVAPGIGMSTPQGSLSAFPGVMPFLTFLYQRGGSLYLPDGVKTDLNNEIAVEAFRLWTDLYELYKIPLQYNPQNRFRTGETPIVIDNYPFYNILQVFAPEIRGKWGFTLVPGTLREDGTIDRTIPAGAMAQGVGSADMIMAASDKKEEAWEFLKWWTSTEVQARYGRELESAMGVAARHPTANMEANKLLPWTVEEINEIQKQWQYVKGIPEVPGGYMTGRHLDNAFRKVYNEQEDARETLLDYVRKIDEELEIKRDEFGLETEVDVILEKAKENPELYIWWE